MSRTLVGLFLIAHGFVTLAMWVPEYAAVPEGQVQPPNPSHSWVFGDARRLSVVLGVLVGLALAAAGVAFLTDQGWWPQLAIASGGASLVLFGVFFTPWWLAGIAISTALIVGALRAG